jgi:hypothetical protein
MDFYIQSDTNSFIHQALDPERVRKSLVDGDEAFRYMRNMQKLTDDMGQWKYGQRVSGGVGAIKVIARMPQSVMIKLMEVEPDLLRDKKTFYKILDAHPIYAAYTRKASGGAA